MSGVPAATAPRHPLRLSAISVLLAGLATFAPRVALAEGAAGEASDDPAQPAAVRDTEQTREGRPWATLSPDVRVSSGTPGLDEITETNVPATLAAFPFAGGRVTLLGSPTFLSAGSLPGDADNQSSFGSAAFGGRQPPPRQHAEGVGFNAAYEQDWVRADIGSTPFGFPLQSVLGGVELSPDLTDALQLRLSAERRVVNDSVLSYAGTRDTAGNTLWGGVTRTGASAQLELSLGRANFYAGGGWASLMGTRVAANATTEFSAGGAYPVWSNGSGVAELGLDLVYFGYRKNLRFFTLGQGGYFSPQSYFAALVPVSYTAHSGDLTWSVKAAIGYQVYHENASPVFPDDPALQSLLVVRRGGPTGLISNAAKNAAGITDSALASLEWRLSPTWSLGGRVGYQHAGDWTEVAGSLYARYSLGAEEGHRAKGTGLATRR